MRVRFSLPAPCRQNEHGAMCSLCYVRKRVLIYPEAIYNNRTNREVISLRQKDLLRRCIDAKQAWEEFTHALGGAFFAVQNLHPGFIKNEQGEFVPREESLVARGERERQIHNRWIALMARLAVILEASRQSSHAQYLPKMALIVNMAATENIADPDVRKAIQDVVRS